MVALISFLLNMVASPFKWKSLLEAENAALRHQLIVLQRKVRGRVPFTNSDRLFFGAAVSLVSQPAGKISSAHEPASLRDRTRAARDLGQIDDLFRRCVRLWTTNSSKHIPFDWTGP
jgi:hypothetical protein